MRRGRTDTLDDISTLSGDDHHVHDDDDDEEEEEGGMMSNKEGED